MDRPLCPSRSRPPAVWRWPLIQRGYKKIQKIKSGDQADGWRMHPLCAASGATATARLAHQQPRRPARPPVRMVSREAFKFVLGGAPNKSNLKKNGPLRMLSFPRMGHLVKAPVRGVCQGGSLWTLSTGRVRYMHVSSHSVCAMRATTSTMRSCHGVRPLIDRHRDQVSAPQVLCDRTPRVPAAHHCPIADP